MVVVSILLASCGRNIPSLKAVESAVENFNAAAVFLSEDIYESCIRATQFAGTPASPTVFTQRQPKEEFCHENFKRVSTQTGKANEVLTNYMTALVLVANGEREKGKKISFDESFKNLEESLINLKFSTSPDGTPQSLFKEAEVKAGVAIAKFFTNLFTKELRRSNLKKAILCTDSNIQTYIKGEGATEGEPEPGGLIGIANKVYVDGLLVQEELRIRKYFSEYITLLGDDLRKNPLDFMAVEEKYNNAIKSVRENRKKAEAYTEILRNLALLHTSLKADFAKDGDVPLTGEKFENYCRNLFDSSKTKVAEKEENQQVNPETMRRVQKTIARHMQAIEPLLKELEQQK